jgi:hypothetical protein
MKFLRIPNRQQRAAIAWRVRRQVPVVLLGGTLVAEMVLVSRVQTTSEAAPLPVTMAVMSTPVARPEPPIRTVSRKAPKPARAEAPIAPEPATLCRTSAASSLGSMKVTAEKAAVYIQPQPMPTPLKTFARGTEITTTRREGEWFLIRFEDPQWGRRVGFVHCSQLAEP